MKNAFELPNERSPDAPPWSAIGLRHHPDFDRRIEWVEQLAENQTGADKSWVERADREFRAHYARAVRIR